jgi:predicted TIM-barrel fold metal-dependent hydrolase
MSADKLIVVSGDSHATLHPDTFPEYVEAEYQDLLPGVYEDNAYFAQLFGSFANFPPEVLDVIDGDGVWRSGGVSGAWNLDRRIAEMDREGVAAEMIFPGDARALMPLSPMLRRYPQEVVAAGGRAYHRWLTDTFGAASDRMLRVGNPGSGVDIDAMLAELRWLAEHGFVAAELPNTSGRDLPPLDDEYFDPYWSLCDELGLAVAVHAGYGSKQCEFIDKINDIKRKMEAAGRSDLLNEIQNTEGFFALDYRPRRAMWQLMLGGVFDRHPDLRLYLAEIRADWMPGTLRHLDAVFERARADVPARRKPSEYFQSNCLTSLSFVHKAEVEMRHEIGVENVLFGRDFPHAEGTWPNTADWLTDAFHDVPEPELRLMLGENAIRFFALDRAQLAAIAERVGPSIDDVTGRNPDLDPRLIAAWDARGGYLKPPEQVDIDALDALLIEDGVPVASSR